MNKTQKWFVAAEALLITVIVAIVGGAAWYVWHSKDTINKSLVNSSNLSQDIIQPSSVKTFEDCQKDPGSIDQQSYPGVCVTKSGQRFVQPVSSSNQTAAPQ